MTGHPLVQRGVDLRPCLGATLDDLDPDRIEAYRAAQSQRQPAILHGPVERLLTQVGAAVEDRGQLQPTLTGILFFGREPQQFYPSLTITFLHFAGVSTARPSPDAPLYLDNRELRGTLPIMIDSARSTILEKLSKQAVMEGFVRRDVPEYPQFAVREAVVNAVGHRDYALVNAFIQVRLFADRLEVQSPGGLGGHLTVGNIAYEQYTRNPHIMRILEDLGYVERRGLGVDQMIREMVAANLEPPIFENRGSSFWVTLKNRPPVRPLPDLSHLDLNERQKRAVAHLREHGRLTSREHQLMFGVSERVALYDLQGLVEAGLALPVSSGRDRFYLWRD
jgi:ATP-dependent DNA helicase RecG